MEYSLYINQVKTIEWGLTLPAAHLFGYLINGTAWMTRHPTQPDFVWCANAKLVIELPSVCKHKDTARHHMATLEARGLIDRLTFNNRSYFKITDKGFGWKSNTIKAGELSHPDAEGGRTQPPRAGELSHPRAGELSHQSDIPITSDIPVSETGKGAGGVSLPDWMPAQLWSAYVSTRKSMKKHPMNSEALDLVIVSIAKTVEAGYSIESIMEALVECGWRTVKPDYMANRLKSAAPGDESVEERANRLAHEMRNESNNDMRLLP